MHEPTPPWRRIVVEQLELLASEGEQLDYEHGVPHVDITAELLCLWFDDSYHPEDAGFRANFTAAELSALAEFNAYFRERVDRLPKSNGTVKSWLGSSAWREVMGAASNTLHRIAA